MRRVVDPDTLLRVSELIHFLFGPIQAPFCHHGVDFPCKSSHHDLTVVLCFRSIRWPYQPCYLLVNSFDLLVFFYIFPSPTLPAMQGLRPQRLEGIPEHCFQKLSQMEDSFVVGTPSLKTITNHFIEELERGATVPPSTNAKENIC